MGRRDVVAALGIKSLRQRKLRTDLPVFYTKVDSARWHPCIFFVCKSMGKQIDMYIRNKYNFFLKMLNMKMYFLS